MPVKAGKRRALKPPLKGRDGRKDRPLGLFQAKVLKKLAVLGEDAFGYMVVRQLMQEGDRWLDPSKVYTTMRKMAPPKGKLIEFAFDRPPTEHGPGQKVFRLTESGQAALKATAAHYRTIAEYLEA